MAVKNEGITTLDGGIAKTFVGGRYERTLLRPGHELYKYTQYGTVNGKGAVTPWWSSVEPIAAGDPGLTAFQRRAGLTGSEKELARARSAVSHGWNEMTRFVKIAVQIEVYGFAGRCAGMPKWDAATAPDSSLPAGYTSAGELQNVILIGGHYQLYLPNLLPSDIRVITDEIAS